MKEPYESTKRPEFPRQIRNSDDLQVGKYIFAIGRIGPISVQLLQVKSRPVGEWLICTYFLKHEQYTDHVNLCDYSILPYKHEWWNCCNFLISAGKQRTPLTEKEKQALVKELGVTPFPYIRREDEYIIR